jgi:hypothetical protein
VGGGKKTSVPEAFSLARPAAVKKGARGFEVVGGRLVAGGGDGDSEDRVGLEPGSRVCSKLQSNSRRQFPVDQKNLQIPHGALGMGACREAGDGRAPELEDESWE